MNLFRFPESRHPDDRGEEVNVDHRGGERRHGFVRRDASEGVVGLLDDRRVRVAEVDHRLRVVDDQKIRNQGLLDELKNSNN